jgi:hypothetical protein
MSYHRKVIYIALGILLIVTVLGFVGELLDGGKVDGLGIGLFALGFSVFEAVVLLLGAAIIGLFGKDGMQTVGQREDVLDDKKFAQRPLTKGQRAGAFCAAAGLVLLLGGSLCFGSLGLGGSIDVR